MTPVRYHFCFVAVKFVLIKLDLENKQQLSYKVTFTGRSRSSLMVFISTTYY